ncbi:MAG TPA: IS4 family transposase [Acetobacteraceae bacterium]
MPHQNTVFRQLTKMIPWAMLERLVGEHGADSRVRRLTTYGQLQAMMFGQLSGARSLRDIEALLDSHDARRYHAGLPKVKRSTLADANANRPAEVFSGLFAAMVGSQRRKLRRCVGETVNLIDSTGIRLNRLSAHWSRFSAEVCGVKAHVIYDADGGLPVYVATTPARVNDITAAKQMPIEAGATYVFDLGYYDYAWWAKLDGAGCRIVTRLKSNTPLRVTERRPVAKESNILSDRIGRLPVRLAASRNNPMAKLVREIRVRISTGTVLRIVSNDLEMPAGEIAALYKRRWGIELFFKWVKQTLKIRHFYGTSENAVRIQIAVALICFLLIKLAHAQQTAVSQLTSFARLISGNLMHRKPIGRLRRSGPEPDVVAVQTTDQGTFLWA